MAAASEDKALIAVAQRNAEVEAPGPGELFAVGTKAVIKQLARAENGLQVIVQGVERVALEGVEQTARSLVAAARPLPLPEQAGAEVEALHRELLSLTRQIQAVLQPQSPVDLTQLVEQVDDPVRQAYLLASFLGLDLEKQQTLLEAPTREALLRLMHGYLSYELQVLSLRSQIVSQAAGEIDREQRRYFLRQQLRTIQKELGEEDPEGADVALLRQRFDEAKLPDDVRREVQRDMERLERLPPAAPDYQVTRGYLELVLELPWDAVTEDMLDLARARTVLDLDHYDLAEVKQRIIEHLAVLKLNPEAKAPILCFVGPPGVGKTSLGQSIARALGRKFERLSLGGLHDEAELRGHRRTYIGAMPGRLIQAIRRAGVRNPLLMLDEVDKLGRDFRGDPAAALLEILDPAQNHTFRDNFLDLPFDLSKVLFITTANTLDTIPGPLLDRMEVLWLSGYSDAEKLAIARRYLVPRQLGEAGLSAEQVALPDETIEAAIREYTREAGVRQLERVLGRIIRQTAVRFAEGRTEPAVVRPEQLAAILGPPRGFLERVRRELPPGVATGLAWTETGGDVLYIEALLLPARRGLILTGQLGQVMRESARAARSLVWSRAEALGIPQHVLRRSGVHVHVPAGAIPKDGPSAGIAMATALASLFTGEPARSDTAMTGEITLAGLVLPIGGVKEKVLAAHRAGIRQVILPRQNEKDLIELPENVRGDLTFVFAERIEEVWSAAIPALAQRLATSHPLASAGAQP
jgi:ATP-dependent Lon protease